MSFSINRSAISDGIYFNRVKSDKFKANSISVSLVAPLSVDTASDYAILPLILKRGYRQCPTAKQFSRLLSSLYGASCGGSVMKFGDNQILSLSINAIDDKFTLGGESVTAEISKILCWLLLDPVTENGEFKKSVFELEKKSLIDRINAELNDKVALAAMRCKQLMYEGERAAISSYGSLETAQALGCREVFDSYNELLKKAHIEIIFVGPGDSEAAEEIFTSCFKSAAEREKPFDIYSVIKRPEREVKRKTEEFSVSQSKLSMGFTCGGEVTEDETYALNFMTTILGKAPFSKLFMNVREKMSLCYYCSAAYDKTKGTVLINSGIEPQNRELAENAILAEISAMQNGEISDYEMESAKKLYSNILNSIDDSMGTLEQFLLPRLIIGNQNLPSYDLEKYLSLTKEDIINAARKLKLNTVYFMAPKEEN